MDGTEQNVLEALVREDAEENIQEAEMTDEEGFDIENLPENQNLRKIFIEERLIEAIRRRPPLWNFRLPITERGVRSKEKLWMDVIAVMKGTIFWNICMCNKVYYDSMCFLASQVWLL